MHVIAFYFLVVLLVAALVLVQPILSLNTVPYVNKDNPYSNGKLGSNNLTLTNKDGALLHTTGIVYFEDIISTTRLVFLLTGYLFIWLVSKWPQWFSALSAKTWVQAPPMTSGVYLLYQSFSTQQSNPIANICAMCPNKLAQSYQEHM